MSNPSAAAPARKGKGLLIVVVLLVLAGAGAGGWFAFGRSGTGEDADPAKAEAVPSLLYHALAPPFVVNLADADVPRYLQAEVTVTARDGKVIEALERHDPIVRNRLVLLFGQYTMAALQQRSDKERLQAEALTEVRAVLAEHGEQAEVESLFFTSLVTQ